MKALRVLAAKLGVTPEYLETGSEPADAQERELRLAEAELALRLDRDTASAESVFRAVLADARTHDDGPAESRARIGLGLVAAHRGDHEASIEWLEPVVGERSVTPSSHPDVFATLGHSYASVGRADEGAALLRRAFDDVAGRSPVDAASVVRFATYLSYALSDLGDLAGAREAVAQALEHAAGADDPYTRIRLYWSNARLATVGGDHGAARSSISRAIALLESTEDTAFLGRAHVLAAELALYEGDLDDARDHLDAGGLFVGTASEAQDRAWLCIQRALVDARAGNAPAAIDQATEAVELLDDREDPTLRGRAQWALGEALAATGARSAARIAFTRASSLIPPGSKYATPFMEAWSRAFPADAEAGVS
jgi:tetratricopeptide (TPR) repeat protein